MIQTECATLYDQNGNTLTEGLQPASICDQAIIVARETAARRNEDVILHDDDGYWIVSPDGSATEKTAKQLGFDEDDD
jgi:hypothetical protein